MWANSVWGLLSLAVTFGLALLLLIPEQVLLRPYFQGLTIFCAVMTVVVLIWPLRRGYNRAKLLEICRHPAKWIPRLLSPNRMITGGLFIIIIGVIVVGIGIWRQSQPVAHSSSVAPTPPAAAAARYRLTRVDYEQRRQLLNRIFQEVNGPIRDAYNAAWLIRGDQPKSINANQKSVYLAMRKIRDQIIPEIPNVSSLVRESELYPDIRSIDWNFHQPLLNVLNDLINKLHLPVENGQTVFIDSKETDQLQVAIDRLGKWIEAAKEKIQQLRALDDKAEVIDSPATARAYSTTALDQAPKPNSNVVQWNTIFGTTRSPDTMIALFLDGHGPDTKSLKMRDAYIESGITGEVIKMRVAAGDDPMTSTFPITEASRIPPKGFLRLVAVLNSAEPNRGISNKDFIDRWRKVWFNVTYEDGAPDRILFDEATMESYLPNLVGPHVTRQATDTRD